MGNEKMDREEKVATMVIASLFVAAQLTTTYGAPSPARAIALASEFVAECKRAGIWPEHFD